MILWSGLSLQNHGPELKEMLGKGESTTFSMPMVRSPTGLNKTELQGKNMARGENYEIA